MVGGEDHGGCWLAESGERVILLAGRRRRGLLEREWHEGRGPAANTTQYSRLQGSFECGRKVCRLVFRGLVTFQIVVCKLKSSFIQ